MPSAEISSTFRSVVCPGATRTGGVAAIATGTASAAIAITATPSIRSRSVRGARRIRFLRSAFRLGAGTGASAWPPGIALNAILGFAGEPLQGAAGFRSRPLAYGSPFTQFGVRLRIAEPPES